MSIENYLEKRIKEINIEYELVLNRRLMLPKNKKAKLANLEGQLSALEGVRRALIVAGEQA